MDDSLVENWFAWREMRLAFDLAFGVRLEVEGGLTEPGEGGFVFAVGPLESLRAATAQ